LSQHHRFPLPEFPLSRGGLDRDHAARLEHGLLDRLWDDESTRVLYILDGQALLSGPGRLQLLPPSAVARPAVSAYLGRTLTDRPDVPAGTRIIAAQLENAAHLADADWVSLRAVGDSLEPEDAGLFTQALAILNWHDSHRFSPRTGGETFIHEAGWVRKDDQDNPVFPRTDPAVIVAVLDDDDRILLGANAAWGGARYSLLAGFVDPGESLEAAVIREIREESGLNVVDPVYLGSQPWPFPSSLMLGFSARVSPDDPGVLMPDGEEIIDLRWFTREELAMSGIGLPMRSSIARAIIEAWYGGPIGD